MRRSKHAGKGNAMARIPHSANPQPEAVNGSHLNRSSVRFVSQAGQENLCRSVSKSKHLFSHR
jgi:hypothetical protein